MAPTVRPPRLLYVVSLFPCWSETFIVRELATLIAAGADVRILSLKAPSEKMVHAEAERLLPRVRHPLAPAPAALARTRAFAAHPRLLSSLMFALGRALHRRPVDLAKSLEALARGVEQLDWIREFDPDVVYAHWATFPSTAALALARILGKPFGFTCHAHDIYVNDQLIAEKIDAAAVPVTISRFNVDWLTEKVSPRARERLNVVHCGVDLTALPFRADGREEATIVTVGRLDPIKGFEVLVDAVGELARQGRRVRCRIIGEGPLRGELEAQIARLGLGGAVELLGARPQAEVKAALYAATIFALPSVVAPDGNRDGIPVSLMEAMAAGTPVVSTLCSGIPELVADGREGLLVPTREPAALAGALGKLLDDADLRRRLAEAARAKIEREFDAAQEARKLLELFTHVIARA
ncbi:MAG TPA: glycosyltransferase [Polyangia bacterium]|nr:glycosyltransferase [Polyangia bacterium]